MESIGEVTGVFVKVLSVRSRRPDASQHVSGVNLHGLHAEMQRVLGCHAEAQTSSEASHMIFKLDRHAVVSEVCVRVMGVDTKELV